MQLYFIRHGETEFNKQHRAMGQRFDEALDESGLQQAHEVIAKLPADFTAVYSSPLKRAAQTAQIIADYFNKHIVIDPDLKERDFGDLSGKTWEQMDQETGLPIRQLDETLQYDYQPYGGESAQQVKARLERFLNDLKAKHQPSETVVVVCHYGQIRMMNSMYQHEEYHQLSNTSVHKFTV